MKESSLFILVLHAVLLVIQLGLVKMLPRLKQALFGVYFILMPVGFSFFTDVEPWLHASITVFGLAWILVGANRALSPRA